jgi:hypothetical protein
LKGLHIGQLDMHSMQAIQSTLYLSSTCSLVHGNSFCFSLTLCHIHMALDDDSSMQVLRVLVRWFDSHKGAMWSPTSRVSRQKEAPWVKCYTEPDRLSVNSSCISMKFPDCILHHSLWKQLSSCWIYVYICDRIWQKGALHEWRYRPVNFPCYIENVQACTS